MDQLPDLQACLVSGALGVASGLAATGFFCTVSQADWFKDGTFQRPIRQVVFALLVLYALGGAIYVVGLLNRELPPVSLAYFLGCIATLPALLPSVMRYIRRTSS